MASIVRVFVSVRLELGGHEGSHGEALTEVQHCGADRGVSGESVAEGENGVDWWGRGGDSEDGEVDEEAEDAGLEWSGGILRSHVDSHNVLISAGSALL